MKKMLTICTALFLTIPIAKSQTLQSVTDSGNHTTRNVSIGASVPDGWALIATNGNATNGHGLYINAVSGIPLQIDANFTPRLTVNPDGSTKFAGHIKIASPIASNPLIGGRNPLYLDAVNYATSNSSAIVFVKGNNPIAEIATDLYSTGGKDIYMIAGQGNAHILLNPYAGSGNIGIGTTTPQSKLSVAGTITAKKVKVTQSGWADFVFQEHYQLPSLQETELYIKANKHLPGIPAAADVEKNGIDLGEMNKLLLQKIEELTLHVIQQQKELAALKAWKEATVAENNAATACTKQ